MARDTNQVLGHADEADGIEEYDNALPDWWLGLFVGSILWAVGYAAYHLMVPSASQLALFDAEMAASKVRWPPPAAPATIAMDPETLAAGEVVFAQTCASCHKADMSGGIGPNLVDDVWIHGSSIEEIRATVTHGVLEKGMPAWEGVIGPVKVAQVSAYIVSKQGSAPAPAPAPEVAGDAVDPRAAGEAVWTTYCVACHGEKGEGGQIGPNLLDATWIHGSDLESIRKVITNGVPEKAMVAWGPILGDTQIDHVARLVHSRAQDAAQ